MESEQTWLDVMRRPLARLRRAILAAICLVYMEKQSFELDTVTHALHDALLDATVRLTPPMLTQVDK